MGRSIHDHCTGRATNYSIQTSSGASTMSGQPEEPLALTALRDLLDHWQRGVAPPISVHDCYRTMCLIDQAYEIAGKPYG